MALFQPTSVSPSENGSIGNGTVDISHDLQVSWQVNGNPPLLTKFKITIYKNDTASTQVYTTGELTENCPFYGTDYNGNLQYFSYTIPAAILASAGMANGNEYKLIIQQWWTATDSVTQTSASVFITRAAPMLSISNLPSPLTSRTFSFLAAYTQAQNDALTWVQWQLADAADTHHPFLDTGHINTAQLRLDYDGFLTGNTYAVRCLIETENGISADTGWQTFKVSYSAESLDGYVTACHIKGHGGVMLRWSNIYYIYGAGTGGYSISDNVLFIPSGSSVAWDSVTGTAMRLSPPWAVYWQGTVPIAGGTPLRISGENANITLEFDAEKVYIKKNGTVFYNLPFVRRKGDKFTVIITQEKICVRIMRLTGGLYPSSGLFPSTSLYPRASHYAIYGQYSVEAPTEQFPITSLTLSGEATCDFLYVYNGTPTSEETLEALGNLAYIPVFDDHGYFCCNFKNGLQGGNVSTAVSGLKDFAVYRMKSGADTLERIATIPMSSGTSLIDYSAVSQQGYLWYVFAEGDHTLSASPYVSNPLAPLFWAWAVLECEVDENGVYHVLAEYQFKYNVNSGSISNNNSPEMLENFTPYPLIQRKNTNYQSGTLTALIGSVSKGQYSNTAKLKNNLMELSVTPHALFLKNRIGDILRIHVSAPITMTTNDATVEQVQTIALPWAETGSAEGVTIVSVPTDDFWPA